jgi:hypothetical protein
MTTETTLYLGRRVDEQNQLTDAPIHYPADHLTTHALLLGATGSGKTGLGLVLVEEALRQGIPVLLLDVKGDLSNLLLTFPELAAADIAPWIDADVARRRGQTAREAAQAAASRWREGLATWGLGPDDIAQLRRRADLLLCTPGLRAGRPIDILARFSAPPGSDPDVATLRAQGLTSALLGLAGVNADPLKSREHILLTNLVRHAWETQGALDIPTLIQQVQQPPMDRVGVFDLESFFPQDDRFELALTLNNLIAAPGFARWREGEPLDVDRFLRAPDGRPRATVFYMAHLPEDQRHFFVTLFLEELRAWVRAQAGTRALRALLVFDEIYGYLPPYPRNPPSKAPLMALVKQGRAAGLGVVLSTQNPGDLDYKSLGNIGTWFVGALRTDRDKDRVLEGMEGAIADAGMRTSAVETALSRLKPRIFLMHDTRARDQHGALRFFHSRWALSYLRGPLTAAEARDLAAAKAPPTPAPEQAATAFTAGPVPQPAPPQDPDALSHPPAVDPGIPQGFLPATITAAWALRNHTPPLPTDLPAQLTYRPHLLGVGVAHIIDDRANIAVTDEQVWRVASAGENWKMRWDQGEMIALNLDDLIPTPPGSEAVYAPLPGQLARKTSYTKWESALKTHIYHQSQITIWGCTRLRLYSGADENKRAFIDRCRREMEQRKQADLEEERQKYERKRARLEKRIRKEELELEQEEEELAERRREELLSGAETVLNLLSKRRRSRALSQTSRQRRYVKKARADVEESAQSLNLYEEELEQLAAAWRDTAAQITQEWTNVLDDIREVTVRAKRSDIQVRFCGLAWFPVWEVAIDGQRHALPAYVPQDAPG